MGIVTMKLIVHYFGTYLNKYSNETSLVTVIKSECITFATDSTVYGNKALLGHKAWSFNNDMLMLVLKTRFPKFFFSLLYHLWSKKKKKANTAFTIVDFIAK